MESPLAAAFADARPVAQHCAELTDRGPRPEERAECLSAWRRNLAFDLAQQLSPLLSGGKLDVRLGEPEMVPGKDVFERIGPVAVNCLLRCGDGDQTMLLSLDFATAIALTDCSFGGEGQPPEEIPPQLPRSAALMVDQFASTIAGAIVSALGADVRTSGDVLVRSESVTRLKPFPASAEIACFELAIEKDVLTEWRAMLAVPSSRLDSFLPGLAASASTAGRAGSLSDGTSGPFAQLPVPVEAVLSEFELSLSRLERLAPGDEIPLAIPREVPLRVDEQVFAHGALGTLENRMALRVVSVADSTQPTRNARPMESAA